MRLKKKLCFFFPPKELKRNIRKIRWKSFQVAKRTSCLRAWFTFLNWYSFVPVDYSNRSPRFSCCIILMRESHKHKEEDRETDIFGFYRARSLQKCVTTAVGRWGCAAPQGCRPPVSAAEEGPVFTKPSFSRMSLALAPDILNRLTSLLGLLIMLWLCCGNHGSPARWSRHPADRSQTHAGQGMLSSDKM